LDTKDEHLIDLLAMYCLQIDELMKYLTPSGKEQITFTNDVIMKDLRNQLAHNYDSVKKEMLIALALKVSNKNSILEIDKRIKYCMENRQGN